MDDSMDGLIAEALAQAEAFQQHAREGARTITAISEAAGQQQQKIEGALARLTDELRGTGMQLQAAEQQLVDDSAKSLKVVSETQQLVGALTIRWKADSEAQKAASQRLETSITQSVEACTKSVGDCQQHFANLSQQVAAVTLALGTATAEVSKRTAEYQADASACSIMLRNTIDLLESAFVVHQQKLRQDQAELARAHNVVIDQAERALSQFEARLTSVVNRSHAQLDQSYRTEFAARVQTLTERVAVTLTEAESMMRLKVHEMDAQNGALSSRMLTTCASLLQAVHRVEQTGRTTGFF